MTMNFNELRKLQRNERNNGTLQQAPDTLYNDMNHSLKKEEDYRLIRSKKVIINDIKRIRFTKLVKKAMYIANTNDNTYTYSHMTPDEKQFFKAIVQNFKKWRQK